MISLYSSLVSGVGQLLLWLLSATLLYWVGRRLEPVFPGRPRMWWLLLGSSLIPLLPLWPQRFDNTVIPDFLMSAPFAIDQLQTLKITLNDTVSSSWTNYISISLCSTYGAGLAYQARHFFRQRRQIKRLLQTAQYQTISGCPVPVAVVGATISPFVFGIFHPTLVLPKYALSLPTEQKQALLAHEITHLSLKDPLAILVWRFLTLVFWFNPVIKKMEARFIQAMELRCDRSAIQKHNLSPIHYAQAMLTSLRYCVEMPKSTVTAPHFSASSLSLRDYKHRMNHIMKPKNIGVKDRLYFVLAAASAVFSIKVFAAPLLIDLPLITSEAPQWIYPVESPAISAHFGVISSIRNNKAHKGVDFKGNLGTPVVAAGSGKVIVANDKTLHKNYGNVVLIQHANGFQSLYAHLNTINVSSGDYIQQGDRLGTLGNSGKSTGPHLHFELIHQRQRIDPTPLLSKK